MENWKVMVSLLSLAVIVGVLAGAMIFYENSLIRRHMEADSICYWYDAERMKVCETSKSYWNK